MARQISPRPYLAMKLIASGVTFSAASVRSPSFSRSSSSTTTIMRPARISSIAAGTSTKDPCGFISRIVANRVCQLATVDLFCQRLEEYVLGAGKGKDLWAFDAETIRRDQAAGGVVACFSFILSA